jgi:hypothetical protein
MSSDQVFKSFVFSALSRVRKVKKNEILTLIMKKYIVYLSKKG